MRPMRLIEVRRFMLSRQRSGTEAWQRPAATRMRGRQRVRRSGWRYEETHAVSAWVLDVACQNLGAGLSDTCKNLPRSARREPAVPLKRDIDSLRRTPAYPFIEAAHYLGVPVSTLRAWCLGQDYHAAVGGPRHFVPLIQLDGERAEGLSFLNLVEAHVLAAIRRVHRVPLPKVRRALIFVGDKLEIGRPLVDIEFETNGVDLFVRELDRLVNASSDGQLEMAPMLRAFLHRVERDPKGVPIKLFPFTRKEASEDSPRPVVIDPLIAFGRPVLRGHAVPTAVLADRFKAGDTVKELAGDYGASTEDIEEAIRCELDRAAAA